MLLVNIILLFVFSKYYIEKFVLGINVLGNYYIDKVLNIVNIIIYCNKILGSNFRIYFFFIFDFKIII